MTDTRRYRNVAEGLTALNSHLNDFYTSQRHRKLTRITPLVRAQLKAEKPGYPYLKASAAGCRHAAEHALALAHQHLHGVGEHGPYRFRASHPLAGRSDEHNQLVVDMMEGLVSYQRASYTEPFDPHACRQAMYQFLQKFIDLHRLWRAVTPEDTHHSLPFHARPKAHLLQHLVDQKIWMFGSPNEFHCYMDEDFVGSIKGVCAASKHPATLEKRVSQKCQLQAGVSSCTAFFEDLGLM